MTSEELKQSISMRELVESHGIKVNSHGFCHCPFHKEKTGSMKIYKDSYHCFGCGRSGDIFSFIMGMENCDFKTAYKRLGGSYKQSSDYQHKLHRYRMEKRKQTEQKRAEEQKRQKRELLKDIWYQRLFVKLFPVFSDDWCDAVNRLEYDFYLLDELTKRGDGRSETTQQIR